jgi:hypothetical protein
MRAAISLTLEALTVGVFDVSPILLASLPAGPSTRRAFLPGLSVSLSDVLTGALSAPDADASDGSESFAVAVMTVAASSALAVAL